MANSNDTNESRWVEERLSALDADGHRRPDVALARGRLRERQSAAARRTRRTWTMAAMATIGLALLALPWPRAAAQRLWDRLTLGRVEVVQVTREDLAESVTAAFEWHDLRRDEPVMVRDAAEAERVAGFRPLLPPADVINETPQLAVVKSIALSTPPLRVRDIERALAAAGVSDVDVPDEWEGITLVAERGPMVLALYPNAMLDLTQSPPFKLTTPPGFPVGRFMEMAYRVFGKSAADAKDLSRKFVANPAWLLVFPGHDTVDDVTLSSGEGVVAGGQGGMCFFWNTQDRIFIISAAKINADLGVAVANSIQ